MAGGQCACGPVSYLHPFSSVLTSAAQSQDRYYAKGASDGIKYLHGCNQER